MVVMSGCGGDAVVARLTELWGLAGGHVMLFARVRFLRCCVEVDRVLSFCDGGGGLEALGASSSCFRLLVLFRPGVLCCR